MSEHSVSAPGSRSLTPYGGAGTRPQPASLADVLERVLDKGIIIAGDIKVNLLDIELLTIKIRLLVVSVDKAQEMGIDWWRNDPMLSTSQQELVDENRRLRERLDGLEGGETAEEGESTAGGTDARAGRAGGSSRSSAREPGSGRHG